MDDNPITPDVVNPDPSATEIAEAPTSSETYNAAETSTVVPAETVATETDQATVTRLQQDVARNNRLLSSLGIDPSSDAAERVEAGLVDPQDLLPRPVAAPAIPEHLENQSAPPSLDDIISRVQKEGGASNDDFVDALRIIQDQSIQQKNVHHQQMVNQTISDCTGAVNQVYDNAEGSQSLPDNLKEIEQQLFLSSTDNLVLEEANKTTNPNSYMNPNAYNFFANKNADRFSQLRNHYMEQGRQMALTGQTIPSNTIQPLAAGDGASPNTPGQAPITGKNWKQRGRDYMNNRAAV